MRGLIRCCLFLCFPVLLWAQDGVQVKRERVFTGSGLYGFMRRGRAVFGVWRFPVNGKRCRLQRRGLYPRDLRDA